MDNYPVGTRLVLHHCFYNHNPCYSFGIVERHTPTTVVVRKTNTISPPGPTINLRDTTTTWEPTDTTYRMRVEGDTLVAGSKSRLSSRTTAKLFDPHLGLHAFD